jgi:hypothetical protein
MVSIADSGGISDDYGGKYLDERKRVMIEKIKSPKEAVEYILKKIVHNNGRICCI